MAMTDKRYLEAILHSAKLELKELNVVHRIEIATYNTKSKSLQDQIDSIERQLSDRVSSESPDKDSNG
jgi:hypothetical protein